MKTRSNLDSHVSAMGSAAGSHLQCGTGDFIYRRGLELFGRRTDAWEGNQSTKPMNNSTQVAIARNPHTRPRQGIGCWRRLLAAGLTLGLAAVLQTARADSVIYLNDFNNATNNIANNDLGIGGGFTAFSYNNGVSLYFPSAFETNTWNGKSGGFAVLADSIIGDLYSSLDTINPFNLNGGGTTFELSGVSFSTNTPIPNGGGGASGNVDRLIWGVTTIAPAGAWLSDGPPGAIPTGFWIQFNSDSLVTGTGQGGWSGTSTLFYKDTGTNVYQLCSWKFDNLYVDEWRI